MRPDPCSTALTDLAGVLMVHVQGYPAGATFPSCLADVRAGTAALVVRRLATCVAGDVNCAAANPGQIYFQSSLCNSELANLAITTHYAVAYQPSSGTGPFGLTQHDCHTQAPLRAYVVHIYFVAGNNEPGDGVPTLKRAELGADGTFTIVPLVEGIENLQLEYGVDGNGDSSPDVVNADPGSLNGCVLDTCYIANWVNVMSVNVHLLSRASEGSAGYVDRKSYALGTNPDGTNLVVGPFYDRYKRHAYQQTIRFNNPAQRRQG